MNKFSPVLSLPALRLRLGDRRSPSLRDFMDARSDAIILVALAADEIFAAASFMGTLILNTIGSSIMRSGRKVSPFFLDVDEFQNLAAGSGDQFAMMISESRRFGLGLVLSHQSTSQLDPNLRVLTINVVSTHVIFSTGAVDADLLAGELVSDEPKTVLKQILLSQRPGEAMLVRRGSPTVRIRAHYSPPPSVPDAAVQALRQAALQRHGRSAADIEEELRSREARYLTGPAERVPKQRAATAPKPSPEPIPATAPSRPGKRNPASRQVPPGPDQYEVRDNGEQEGG